MSTIFAPILIRPLNAQFVAVEADSDRPRDMGGVVGGARTHGSKSTRANHATLFTPTPLCRAFDTFLSRRKK